MKATGIVRRIDDLGRVVIPKEIRRVLRIKEGDPLEIFTERDGEVIFKNTLPSASLATLPPAMPKLFPKQAARRQLSPIRIMSSPYQAFPKRSSLKSVSATPLKSSWMKKPHSL